MAINYPNLPKLNASDVGGFGGFDLGEAIKSGLGNYNLYQETKFKPRNLENEAYGKELANKINEAKAKYAMQQALADLQYTQAGTGSLGAQAALHRGQLKMLPYEQQFKIAQALEARAKASKAAAIQNAWEKAFADSSGNQGDQGNGGNTSYQPTTFAEQLLRPSEAPSYQNSNGTQQSGNKNRANLQAALLGIPIKTQVLNGQLITENPLSGITSTKIGPSESETKQSEQDVKTRTELEVNIPQAYQVLTDVNNAIRIAESHPHWFTTHTPFTGPLTGVEATKRKVNDPEFGILESILEGLIGPKAKELSGSNKVLATAFGISRNIKPTIGENQKNAVGKLHKIKDELERSINLNSEKYNSLGGRQKFFVPQTTFRSKLDFHNYMKGLTPQQRQLVRNSISKKRL